MTSNPARTARTAAALAPMGKLDSRHCAAFLSIRVIRASFSMCPSFHKPRSDSAIRLRASVLEPYPTDGKRREEMRRFPSILAPRILRGSVSCDNNRPKSNQFI